MVSNTGEIDMEKVHPRSLNLSSNYKIIPQLQNQIYDIPQLTKPFTLRSSVVLTPVLSDVATESAWAPHVRMPRARPAAKGGVPVRQARRRPVGEEGRHVRRSAGEERDGRATAGEGGARLRGGLVRWAAVGDAEHDDDSGPPLAWS
uniref:Uncharacterized protein n=1 Tax=Oryza nivara TaxID=4536 RepID=A0A679BAB2_ORYNI|nr:hypothetical protein [Oryza sativa f. spontanea]BBF89861.1 hypothetical protein [Oryza sativa f. spontanea]